MWCEINPTRDRACAPPGQPTPSVWSDLAPGLDPFSYGRAVLASQPRIQCRCGVDEADPYEADDAENERRPVYRHARNPGLYQSHLPKKPDIDMTMGRAASQANREAHRTNHVRGQNSPVFELRGDSDQAS